MPVQQLVRLANHPDFPKVNLVEPVLKGFVLLAGEVDHRPPFAYFLESSGKRKLIRRLDASLGALEACEIVDEVTLLKASIIPPGRGSYLRKRPRAHIARYDVAVLIQTKDVSSANQLLSDPAFSAVERSIRDAATSSYRMVGENVRRIDSVDHRSGAFLINYFLSDNEAINLDVWGYTAGWFQRETGLDNSVLMRPLTQDGATYTLLNHCRWNGLADILPSLLFKRSFRSYVLAHFAANDTAAMPVLYRRA